MSIIDIILPAAQLEGTSATLSKWLINIGQQIKAGEPLIELETDKVSMEICASATGTLRDIIACEGEDIAVDTVLGHLDTDSSAEHIESAKQDIDNKAAIDNKTNLPEVTGTHELASRDQFINENNDGAHHLIGPAARRLLKRYHVDPSQIGGSGYRGRVTRNDVLAYVENGSTAKTPIDNTAQSIKARELKSTMVPHTTMRKTIANHMVNSLLQTSPHVTSVFEMNMSNIIEHRKWHEKEYAEYEVNLTFTAYFLAAIVKAVQTVPQVNARFHEHALELFSEINIGVGTALGEAGLVVPVVQQVQSLKLFEIAKALTIQTQKARSGKLTPGDMKNGTFTISNHGVSGSLFATPIIINQPEVAILGIGKLEKRVTVEEISGVDTVVIKPQCYVSLSIDHRALDAHQTNLFLAKFVDVIENWS